MVARAGSSLDKAASHQRSLVVRFTFYIVLIIFSWISFWNPVSTTVISSCGKCLHFVLNTFVFAKILLWGSRNIFGELKIKYKFKKLHMCVSVFSGLSVELQTVLRMMLAPDPSDRPTVSELLALPAVWKHRWKRHIYLMVTETVLILVSLCQVVCLICLFGCPEWCSAPLCILSNSLYTVCTPVCVSLRCFFFQFLCVVSSIC